MAALYIHIPFCHAKCAYCDFYSTPRTDEMEAVTEAICREFELRRHEIDEPFLTLYLGGGTPSLLPSSLLDRLLSTLRPHLTDIEEFTIEANPEDITTDKAREWLDSGINRVSIGVQSLNDMELQFVGRLHSAKQALDAISTVYNAGITNISVDVIFGLPGQTIHSLRTTLNTLFGYPVTHLSAYCLTYEPGTRLEAMSRTGKITETDDTTLEEMYRVICDTTKRAGFEHYEISNYARQGFRSRHNSAYWDNTPYLGLGPAAHSFDGNVRRHNPSSIKKYLNQQPTITDEENELERLNDMILTRLRTSDGLPLSTIPQQYRGTIEATARPYIIGGRLIHTADGRLIIPSERWLTADTIIRDFIQITED